MKCQWPACDSPASSTPMTIRLTLKHVTDCFCWSHWARLSTEQEARIWYGPGEWVDRVNAVLEELNDGIPY